MRGDEEDVFAMLMQRPDIDQATRQYQQLQDQILSALSKNIPHLATWHPGSKGLRASCAASYPGIDFDGETKSLDSHVVPGNLPDADYEKALTVIGTIAQRYGFDPRPQRLHDEPGAHDAMFHNVHDEAEISFGTAKNTSIDVSLGCHLTAEAKRRGTPSSAG